MSDYAYIGLEGGVASVFDVEKGWKRYELPPRLDLVNHSPTGFAWGYGGSGPAQLALAMLVWEFGETFALEGCRYQLFKRDVIAGLDEEWILTSSDLERWRAEVEQGSAFESPDRVLYNGCAGCLPPEWSTYSQLEVMPVMETGGCCEVVLGDGKPDFWSIYGRRRDDGTVEAITDTPEEKMADLMAARFSRHTGLVVIGRARIPEGGA